MWNFLRRRKTHALPKNVTISEDVVHVPFPDQVSAKAASTFLVAIATSIRAIETHPPHAREVALSDLFLTVLNMYVDEL